MGDVSEAASELGVTRRTFLSRSLGAAAIGVAGPISTLAEPRGSGQEKRGVSSFVDVVRVPDRVVAYAGIGNRVDLTRAQTAWQAKGIEVAFKADGRQMPIRLSAPGVAVTHLHLRWQTEIAPNLRCLGDHWERSYGDLSWRGLVPERVMPWYFVTYDGAKCHGYGVKTGARSLCFWQLDPEGVSLWLNLCNGGDGVQLGNRELLAATVVSHEGGAGEGALPAIHAFCTVMCEKPRLPREPIYGSNDWYYAYGKNSEEQTLRDADMVAELSAANAVRPFVVIDMGWENSAAFHDMEGLAGEMRRRKVRPGIWIRPLLATATADRGLLMADARFGKLQERAKELAYDPTHPEALELIRAKVRQVVNWGYELVKHDFSTYDLLGKWGFEMGAEPTVSGWSLHDRSRTNAEVMLNLYEAIRREAGEQTLLLGCNTVGHLGAGIFELQRTGDDTSGEHWERTRKMGVNTLAFRLAQNGTFFVQDADCVGITKAIPWDLNRQWLDVLARSGTALFISPAPDAMGAEQRKAIAEAFGLAAMGGTKVVPEDWMETTTPERWGRSGGGDSERRYRWCTPGGAFPFSS